MNTATSGVRSRFRSHQKLQQQHDAMLWKDEFKKASREFLVERFWQRNGECLKALHPLHARFLVNAAVNHTPPASQRRRVMSSSSPQLEQPSHATTEGSWFDSHMVPDALRRKFFYDLLQLYSYRCAKLLWTPEAASPSTLSQYKNRVFCHVHPAVEAYFLSRRHGEDENAVLASVDEAITSAVKRPTEEHGHGVMGEICNSFNFRSMLFPDPLLRPYLQDKEDNTSGDVKKCRQMLPCTRRTERRVATIMLRHRSLLLCDRSWRNSFEDFGSLGSPADMRAHRHLQTAGGQPFPVDLAHMNINRNLLWSAWQAEEIGSDIENSTQRDEAEAMCLVPEIGAALHDLERAAAVIRVRERPEKALRQRQEVCRPVFEWETHHQFEPFLSSIQRYTKVDDDPNVIGQGKLALENTLRNSLCAAFVRLPSVQALFPAVVNALHEEHYAPTCEQQQQQQHQHLQPPFDVMEVHPVPLSSRPIPPTLEQRKETALDLEPQGARTAVELHAKLSGSAGNATPYSKLSALQRAAFHFSFNDDRSFRKLTRPLLAHEAYARHRRIEEGLCLPDGRSITKDAKMSSDLVKCIHGPRELRYGKPSTDAFEVLMHVTRFRCQVAREFRELSAEEQNAWEEEDPLVRSVFPLVSTAPSTHDILDLDHRPDRVVNDEHDDEHHMTLIEISPDAFI